ncbi:MAG: hypothetical protein ACI8RD_005916 [Bacillariaceae sp.]|jgi:hypothetical protein
MRPRTTAQLVRTPATWMTNFYHYAARDSGSAVTSLTMILIVMEIRTMTMNDLIICRLVIHYSTTLTKFDDGIEEQKWNEKLLRYIALEMLHA